MRKFLLVVFVGIVLAINVYGFVNHFTEDNVEESTMTVYME